MKTYIKRLSSGKIGWFLRPCQLITGKWAIETRLFNKRYFVVNINFPFFDTQEQADSYLSSNYECEN